MNCGPPEMQPTRREPANWGFDGCVVHLNAYRWLKKCKASRPMSVSGEFPFLLGFRFRQVGASPLKTINNQQNKTPEGDERKYWKYVEQIRYLRISVFCDLIAYR